MIVTAAAILADIERRGGEMDEPAPLRLDALANLAETEPARLLTASEIRYWLGASYNVARAWNATGLLKVDRVYGGAKRYRAADVLCAAMAATS